MSGVLIEPDTVLAGRFRLGEPIGFGGMATVYRATDLRLGRDVAVKVFRRDVADAVDLQRIQREVRLLAAVQSPYVVTVFDAVESDLPGLVYLVLELVEGNDLRTLLEQPRRPSAEFVRRIVKDVASALETLHEQGVVHRDVKPANVLVLAGANRRQNSVAAKLSDFGIAQSVDSTRLTATNFILGTAAYLSPEQVRGAKVRPASDIYSLGLMLIESLTGKPAFAGPVAESAAARLARPPQLPRNSSPALADLLSRMTAIDPSERPRAGEVAAALHDLAGGMTVGRGRTGQTALVPMAPAMPLRSAAMDSGEPTALAERPRKRRTNTAPVARGAGAAVAAAGADVAASAEAAAASATRAVPTPDDQPTAQTAAPTGAAAADAVGDSDGVGFLQGELGAEPVGIPAGEHRAGRLRTHPRTTMLATLAACVVLVGAGSVVLASTGGPFLAGAEESTQRQITALADPSNGSGAGAATDGETTASQVEAQRRTEDLIVTMGAIEAGVATGPPLLPSAAASSTPTTTTSSSPRASTAPSSTPTSTPTHSSTPPPTSSPTPSPTHTPTPTPTTTSTPTPTPTPTQSEPSPSSAPTTSSTPTSAPTSSDTTSTPPTTDTPSTPPASGGTSGNG